jgi:hypothetical protein
LLEFLFSVNTIFLIIYNNMIVYFFYIYVLYCLWKTLLSEKMSLVALQFVQMFLLLMLGTKTQLVFKWFIYF